MTAAFGQLTLCPVIFQPSGSGTAPAHSERRPPIDPRPNCDTVFIASFVTARICSRHAHWRVIKGTSQRADPYQNALSNRVQARRSPRLK
ncbi:MAG TPA: hypothetical protein DCF81_04280 [Erythrobacter sp.]|nr:hypothetical protein [Erythrobacter sp.]